MNPHEDLTPAVVSGLAWYYLIAATMNAAAAAYVSYGEMVSEGASRAGLAPKTRRMPGWLIGLYCALVGLAFVVILFRSALPGAFGLPCPPAPVSTHLMRSGAVARRCPDGPFMA